MWQPAGVRFGALAVVAVACGGGSRGSTIGNHAPGADGDLTAAYYCSIQDGGYKYPSYPCAVRKIDGRWVLAKLGGSQRFRGEVKPRDDGFSFDGEFYCPRGDCTQPMHGELKAIGGGKLRGTFERMTLVIELTPAPDSAFGGASYGGDGYGGFGYGGDRYGMPIQQRGNRRP